MKILFAVSTLMLSFTNVQAEPVRLTSADGSELTALCIAAASSERPLIETAKTYGIENYEIKEINCNGMRLDRFAAMYKDKLSAAPKVSLILKKTDNSAETELCYQALSSFDRYMQLLRERATHDAKLQSELACNGMPVLSFVNRYRNKAEVTTISAK